MNRADYEVSKNWVTADGSLFVSVPTDKPGPWKRTRDGDLLIYTSGAYRIVGRPYGQARADYPAQCTRELDVELTGAPDEDICRGGVDPGTGKCRTCGADYARRPARRTYVVFRDGEELPLSFTGSLRVAKTEAVINAQGNGKVNVA